MRPSRSPLDPRAKARRYFQLAVFVVIAASAATAVSLWWQPLWRIFGDREEFRRFVEGCGPYAPLAFIAAQFVQVVIFFIPGELTQVAGGFIFGVWRGLLYSYLGITAGSLAAFYLGRLLEHAVLDLLVDRETLRKFDRLVYGKSGFWPMFILFLIPGIPKDLLCYVAGLTPMHAVTFLFISTVARFPGILLSTIFGEGVADRDWHAMALAAGVTGAFLALAYVFRGPIDRFRKKYLVTKEEMELLGGEAPRPDG